MVSVHENKSDGQATLVQSKGQLGDPVTVVPGRVRRGKCSATLLQCTDNLLAEERRPTGRRAFNKKAPLRDTSSAHNEG